MMYLLLFLTLFLAGLALFFQSDNPFHGSFNTGIWLMLGTVLAGGLFGFFRLSKSRRVWKKWLGRGGFVLWGLLAALCVAACYDYRLFFTRNLSAAEWQQDLDFLAKNIRENHPGFSQRIDSSEFAAQAEAIRQKIPALEDDQVVMEFARLTALLKDGHSAVLPFFPGSQAMMYPIKVQCFSDGWFVIDASPEHRHLIGKKWVGVEKISIETLCEKLAPFVSGDNEWGIKNMLEIYLPCTNCLLAVGAIDNLRKTSFEFESDDGERLSALLNPVSLPKYFYWFFQPLRDMKLRDSIENTLPLYRKKPNDHYWFAYLEDTRTLYFQFNAIEQKKEEAFGDFRLRMMAVAHEKRADRVVIDVRNNSGGNNTLFGKFIDMLAADTVFNREGKLFCLIGRRTFSAAVNLVSSLEARTRVTFVGEPTGAGPNHYGDALWIALPHSKIQFRLSTRYHQFGAPDDSRTEHAPQVPVSVSHLDYFSGKDPVLKRVME